VRGEGTSPVRAAGPYTLTGISHSNPISTTDGFLQGRLVLDGLCWECPSWRRRRLRSPRAGRLRVHSRAEGHSGMHPLQWAAFRGLKVCSYSSNQAMCWKWIAYGVEAVAEFMSPLGHLASLSCLDDLPDVSPRQAVKVPPVDPFLSGRAISLTSSPRRSDSVGTWLWDGSHPQ